MLILVPLIAPAIPVVAALLLPSALVVGAVVATTAALSAISRK